MLNRLGFLYMICGNKTRCLLHNSTYLWAGRQSSWKYVYIVSSDVRTLTLRTWGLCSVWFCSWGKVHQRYGGHTRIIFKSQILRIVCILVSGPQVIGKRICSIYSHFQYSSKQGKEGSVPSTQFKMGLMMNVHYRQTVVRRVEWEQVARK